MLDHGGGCSTVPSADRGGGSSLVHEDLTAAHEGGSSSTVVAAESKFNITLILFHLFVHVRVHLPLTVLVV